jgi:hypothetical protein
MVSVRVSKEGLFFDLATGFRLCPPSDILGRRTVLSGKV